jgi:hypothetical protein
MPDSFRVGDTADCRINQEPARLTWRDPNTLVIEPNDVRRIVRITWDGQLYQFICAESDGSADFTIFMPDGKIEKLS